MRAAADHFQIHPATLARRMARGKSRARARESDQIFSPAEESTLERWITRYPCAGSPMTPALLIELAELLRERGVRHASQDTTAALRPPLIGHEWFYRFLNRHFGIRTIYARELELARFDGASYDKVEAWFNAVAAQFAEYHYDLQCV